MGVNGDNRVNDFIVKELGSFWNKRGRREEASGAGRRGWNLINTGKDSMPVAFSKVICRELS